jgi:hypothetical protein
MASLELQYRAIVFLVEKGQSAGTASILPSKFCFLTTSEFSHGLQSGIGTYTIPQIANPLMSKVRKTLDSMVAFHLDAHVMGKRVLRSLNLILMPEGIR